MSTYLSEDSVRKPLATAHTRNAFTPTVHKAISTIIGYSFFFDPDFGSDTKYYLPLETFYMALDLAGTKNESWIKHDICERLRTHPFEWNVLNRDKTVDWERSSILSTVGIETVDGSRYITYRLNQGFAEKLRTSKQWIIYKLANIVSLKKTASIRLFEHLFSQFMESDTEAFSTVDTLDDVRSILGKEDVHKDYKTFRRDVLEPAVKEIKQKTEIIIEYKAIRQGRRIQKIQWHVHRNEKFRLSENFAQLTLFDEKKLPSGLPISEKAIRLNEMQPIIAQFLRYNVSRKVASELIQNYGLERCESQLRNLEANLAAGGNNKIKEPAGWLVTAIREDFSKAVSKKEEAKKKQEIENSRKKEEKEKWKAAWLQYRAERGEVRIGNLSEKERAEWKQAFIELIRNTPATTLIRGVKSRPPLLKNVLSKEGENGALIELEFRAWLGNQLLKTPEELDFSAYVNAHRNTVSL
ncbi:MAG: replication initiation protein [Gammaproteobacteria bacterium]